MPVVPEAGGVKGRDAVASYFAGQSSARQHCQYSNHYISGKPMRHGVVEYALL